jgi:hypothetical protein
MRYEYLVSGGRSTVPYGRPAARGLAAAAVVVFAAAAVRAGIGTPAPGPGLTSEGRLAAPVSAPRQATETPQFGAQDGVFFGLYGSDFEVSSFVAGTDSGVSGCPGYGAGYWLVGNDSFYRHFRAIYPIRPPYPQMERQIVYTRFYGRLSPPGSYGHLGQYKREITVLDIIDMAPICGCGAAPTPVVTPDPRPDLFIADARWHMPGFNGRCVPVLDGIALHVCVGNSGRGTAGPFTAQTDGDEATWRLSGLPSAESRCLAPKVAFASNVGADVNHEVDEVDEYNNTEFVPMPTFTPPPICRETATPTPALPDLVVDRAWQQMEGFEGYCISGLAPLLTTVCLRNQGGQPVGHFAIRSDDGTGLAWTVSDLGVNETHCVAPQIGAARSVVVDADNAINEWNEGNNRFTLAMATPPIVCTPVPVSVLCPPTPTPTYETSVTPTPTASPTPTATIAATYTDTPRATPGPRALFLPLVMRGVARAPGGWADAQGQIGGFARAIVFRTVPGDTSRQEPYAFLAQGLRLNVLKVGEDGILQPLSQGPVMSQLISDVAVDEQYAYVIAGRQLQILDVSAPEERAPRVVGTYSGQWSAFHVTVTGSLAYLVSIRWPSGQGDHLEIVDIGDRVHPVRRGALEVPGAVTRVAERDGFIYLGVNEPHGRRGLLVIDVRSPTEPREAGFTELPAHIGDLVFGSQHLFVAGACQFWIMDVSAPTSPRIVGSTPIEIDSAAVAVDEDGLGVAAVWEPGLLIQIVVRDPTRPVVWLGGGGMDGDCWAMGEMGYASDTQGDLVIANGNLYLAGCDGGSVSVGHLRFGLLPQYLGKYGAPGDVGRVSVQGDHAVAFDGPALWVVDVHLPTTPRVVARRVSGGVSWDHRKFVIADDKAYVVGWSIPDRYNSMVRVGLSEPEDPSQIVACPLPHVALDVAAIKQWLFLTADETGDNLYAFNTDHPGNPCDASDGPDVSLVASVRANHLLVAGGYLFAEATGGSAVDRGTSVQVYDPANPRQLRLLGSLGLPGPVSDWKWRDGRLYVTDADRGLYIIDASDVGHMRLLGTRPGRSIADEYRDDLVNGRLAVSDRSAFLTAGRYGIEVVSITDPSAPVSLGFAPTVEEYPADVAVAGDYLLVAVGQGGLWITDAQGLSPQPMEWQQLAVTQLRFAHRGIASPR